MAALVDEVGAYLDELDRAQTGLARLYARKRTALRESDAERLLRTEADEQTLVQRLQACARERQRLLERARSRGLPVETLTQLVDSLEHSATGNLPDRISRARRTAELLRHETWVHWIVASRALGHYAALTEMIAHRGEPSPTYSAGTERTATGGAVLDASA